MPWCKECGTEMQGYTDGRCFVEFYVCPSCNHQVSKRDTHTGGCLGGLIDDYKHPKDRSKREDDD